jgi:hypothetical protein
MPAYRTICVENPSGPMNNLKFNVYEVRNGSDIEIFSRMLGTCCGLCTRNFLRGAHGRIICAWHRKVADAQWGACNSHKYVGIYSFPLLRGFGTKINITKNKNFIYCTIFMKWIKKVFRPDDVIINIFSFYLFCIIGLTFYYYLWLKYFSHTYLYIVYRLCFVFKMSVLSSTCTFPFPSLQSSRWLAYIN